MQLTGHVSMASWSRSSVSMPYGGGGGRGECQQGWCAWLCMRRADDEPGWWQHLAVYSACDVLRARA